MNAETEQLNQLIVGMRDAYAAGKNVMSFARSTSGTTRNETIATLIAYDLQTGTYNASVRKAPAGNRQWCAQLAASLAQYLGSTTSLLEVGCGEATTLAGVLASLSVQPAHALGFDLSWSRCAEGRSYLAERDVKARLFVADLFRIPLANDSVDVVYTSHSLEPNGGREEEALRELLRVTRRTLVLFEPMYELADAASQSRMRDHGYVRGLGETLTRLGRKTEEFRLLPYSPNPMNPSGVLVVHKSANSASQPPQFQCPLTDTPLIDAGDVFFSSTTGLAYPVMRGVPLLRATHVVVASKLAEGLLPQ
jgi:SAM-dependent methyltransferase